MGIAALPLLACVAPLAGINLAYWIGVNADVLPSCIPYIDGCTSISATGRYPPGDRLFRAVMLPQAVLLAGTWYLAALWLKSLNPSTRAAAPALACGIVGAVALIVYVTYLGSRDPIYEVMRRYGIYFYFAGTVFAQLFLTFALEPSRLRRAMLATVAVPWVLGLVNFLQKAYGSNPDLLENTIEWIVSVFMQLWFLQLCLYWRKTGFRLTAHTTHE